MFQCTSLVNLSFGDVLFFEFYFDTTLTFFWSPHISFFLCEKHMMSFQKSIMSP